MRLHTQLHTDTANLILEKKTKRLDEFQVHRIRKSAHIMMALDNRTCDRQRLDHIRINRTLPQPLDIFQLMRLLIEDIDKSFADDLTFLLRFRNAR